ncbi:MAG: NAD-dependent epimerase/dehydratase family protein, partial [Desulfobacterales bacterium]
TGTMNVLMAAKEAGIKRVVTASSAAVYGNNPQLPKKEDMKPEPESPYAVAKIIGEYYMKAFYQVYGLQTVSLRYFNVYGPRQDPSSPYSGVISLFMNAVVSKEPPVIYGDGQQYRDFIFVGDVVKANLLAAETTDIGGKIFNVGTGSSVRIGDLWEKICGLSGSNIEPRHAPSRPGDIVESVGSIDRIQSEMGFAPKYSVEEGLKLTFDWYRAEPSRAATKALRHEE